MNRVLGANLVLDTRGWTRGVNTALRSLASMEYVAGRTAGKLGGKFKAGFATMGYASGLALMTSFGSAASATMMFKKVFQPMLRAAADFDFELRRLAFLSGEEFGGNVVKGLKKSIRANALKSTLSEAELTAGGTQLLKSGVNPKDAASMAEPFTRLIEASFGEVSTDELAAIVGIGLNKFKFDGEPVENMERIGDMFLKLTQTTPMALKDIKSWMASLSAAPALSKLTSPEQWLGLQATLASVGQRSRRAGQNVNSFNKGLINMVTQLSGAGNVGKRTKLGLEQFGVAGINEESFFTTDDQGQRVIKNVIDIFDTLIGAKADFIKTYGATGTKEWLTATSNVFSREVSMTMMQLVGSDKLTAKDGSVLKGMDAMRYRIKQMAESQGEAKKGSEAFRKSWDGLVKILESGKVAIQSIIGEHFIETMLPHLKKMVAYIQQFADRLNNNQAFKAKIAKMINGFVVLTTVLSGLLSMLALVGVSILYIIPAFTSIGEFLGSMGGASTFGSVLWQVAALKAGFLTLGQSIGVVIGIIVGPLITALVVASRILNKDLGGGATSLKKKWQGLISLFKGFRNLDWEGDIAITPGETSADLRKNGVFELFRSIVSVITKARMVWRGFISGLDASGMDSAIGKMVEAFSELFTTISGGTDDFGKGGVSKWAAAGNLIAQIINYGIILPITVTVMLVTALIQAVDFLVTSFINLWHRSLLLRLVFYAIGIALGLILLTLGLVVFMLINVFIVSLLAFGIPLVLATLFILVLGILIYLGYQFIDVLTLVWDTMKGWFDDAVSWLDTLSIKLAKFLTEFSKAKSLGGFVGEWLFGTSVDPSQPKKVSSPTTIPQVPRGGYSTEPRAQITKNASYGDINIYQQPGESNTDLASKVSEAQHSSEDDIASYGFSGGI